MFHPINFLLSLMMWYAIFRLVVWIVA